MNKECRFCKIIATDKETIGQNDYFVILTEPAPVSPGHSLIVSRRHALDAFALNHEEWHDFGKALDLAKEQVLLRYTPDGFNVGMNCGEAAGQSQMHFHSHVIPRFKGDVENPIGGIRNLMNKFIPPKK